MSKMKVYKRYKEDLKIMVLDLLKRSPSHAYALMAELENLIGFRPPTSIMYPLLRSLYRDGLVDYTEKIRGGRRLKIYHLTNKGSIYLEDNKDLLQRAMLHAYKHRLMKNIGIHKIFSVLHELHENVDKMSSEQLEEIKRIIDFFERDLRNTIMSKR